MKNIKDVIENDISTEDFEADMKRRLKWVIDEKYKGCYRRLREKWEPELINREIVPSYDKIEFSNQVFAQPDYKNGSIRKAEEAANAIAVFVPVNFENKG